MPDLATAPLLLHPSDNVEVVTSRHDSGGAPLSPGHKLARSPIPEGAAVVKFGQVIGFATEAIPAGAHVHVHNCAFGEHSRDYAIGAGLEAARAAIPAMAPRTFLGYVRDNG